MATTTQILFNSPALHSLKRDQLVKLCKTHSLKANGKNVELIERLKQHAETLPKDSPLSIASRSEDTASNGMRTDTEEAQETASLASMPRPSEQWEMMESIPELEENSSQGSLNSKTGEFGTGSSKTLTMTSSLRSFASSLGLKRTGTSKSTATSTSAMFADVPPVPKHKPEDELYQHAIPYSSIPVPSPSQAPQTDNFTFTPSATIIKKFDFDNTADNTPLPGHTLRPGMPAPANARLSLGLTQATPSRPSLAGPTTTMRLVSNPSAPQNSGPTEFFGTPKLKPFKTSFDISMGSPSQKVSTWPAAAEASPSRLYPTLPKPFVASSPSRDMFEAAPEAKMSSANEASQLASEPFVFGSPNPKHCVSNAQFQSAAASVLEEMNKRLEEEGVESINSGIVGGLRQGPSSQMSKSNRPIKPLRKSAVGVEVKQKFDKAHEAQFNKMESIGAYWNRKMATGSTSSKKSTAHEEPVKIGAKRKSNVLGDSDEPRRPSKQPARPSAAETRVISNGRRAAAMPGGFGDDTGEDGPADDASHGGKRAKVDFTVDPTPHPVPDRTEKEREAIRRKLEMNKARRRSSGAQGRASMGRGSRASVGTKGKPAPVKGSRFGFLGAAAKSIVRGVWGGGKARAPAPTPSSRPSMKPKSDSDRTSNRDSVMSRTRIPSASETIKSTTSSARPPSTSGTINKGAPSVAGSVRSTTTGTRTSNITRNVPSTLSSQNSTSRVSSMGSRSTSGSGLKRTISTSTSSRLLAPTASSLAKTNPSLNKKPNVSSPFSSITNTTASPVEPYFSKPLVPPASSGIPSPVRPSTSDSKPIGLTRNRSTTGRPPRISRSKVIAKLASQRAAGASGAPRSSAGPRAPSKKVRSSLDVHVQRKSAGGSRESAIMMSAKKRARQSDYARRKSRVQPKLSLASTSSAAMDVDA